MVIGTARRARTSNLCDYTLDYSTGAYVIQLLFWTSSPFYIPMDPTRRIYTILSHRVITFFYSRIKISTFEEKEKGSSLE